MTDPNEIKKAIIEITALIRANDKLQEMGKLAKDPGEQQQALQTLIHTVEEYLKLRERINQLMKETDYVKLCELLDEILDSE